MRKCSNVIEPADAGSMAGRNRHANGSVNKKMGASGGGMTERSRLGSLNERAFEWLHIRSTCPRDKPHVESSLLEARQAHRNLAPDHRFEGGPAMLLEGSCHCQAVRFTVESAHPYPFSLCYCSICRKTAGGGGYAINLSGGSETLRVRGEEHLRLYRARIPDESTGAVEESPAERRFCGICGSALWVWDPRWPELVHPFASAIDTVLPRPPERTHLMLDFKAPWVDVLPGPRDKLFGRYPDESLAQWHERLGLTS